MVERRVVDLVEARLDGPHDDESVTDAAEALAELVRLLNRATRSREPRDAATVSEVVGDLATATGRMDQLLAQLSGRLADLAGSPSVSDDRPEGDPVLTAQAAAELLTEARSDAQRLTWHLRDAHRLAARLGSRGVDRVEDES